MPSDDDIQYIDRNRLKWDTNDKLGEGSFGVVYRGYYNRTPAAIKVVRRPSKIDNPTEEQRCLEVNALKQHRREIHRFKVIQNPYIIQYLGVFRDQDPHDLYIVTEFLEGGSLYDSLRCMRDRAAILHDSAFLQIALNIAMGLTHVHSEGYTHGDMKPQNVLLTSAFEFHDYPGGTVATIAKSAKVKIADFGLSKRLNQSADQADMHGSLSATSNFGPGPCGTFLYMSPEAYHGVSTLRDDEVKASDVYAYGLILFELLSCLQSWQLEQVSNPVQLYNLVIDGKRPSWGPHKDNICKGFIDLVESCWSQKCSDRPTVDEILGTLHALEDELNQLPQDAAQPASPSTTSAAKSPNTSQHLELPGAPGRSPRHSPGHTPRAPPKNAPESHPQIHPPSRPVGALPEAPILELPTSNLPPRDPPRDPSRDTKPRAMPILPTLALPPLNSVPMDGQPSPEEMAGAVRNIDSARSLTETEKERRNDEHDFPNSIMVKSVKARHAGEETQRGNGYHDEHRPSEEPKATDESIDLFDELQVSGVPIRKVGSALENGFKDGPKLLLPEGPEKATIGMGSFEKPGMGAKRSNTEMLNSMAMAGNGGAVSDANPGGGLDIPHLQGAAEPISRRNGAVDGREIGGGRNADAYNAHGVGQKMGLVLPLPTAPRSGGSRREPALYNGMGGEGHSQNTSPVKGNGEATTPQHDEVRYKSGDADLADDQLIKMMADTGDGVKLPLENGHGRQPLIPSDQKNFDVIPPGAQGHGPFPHNHSFVAAAGGASMGIPPGYGTMGAVQQPNMSGFLSYGVPPDMGGEKHLTTGLGWGNHAVMQSGNIDYMVQNAMRDVASCESNLIRLWQRGHYRVVAEGLAQGAQLRGEDMLQLCCRFLGQCNGLQIGREHALIATKLCTAIGNVGRGWRGDDSRSMVTKDIVVEALRMTLAVMHKFHQDGNVLGTCNYALVNLFKINNVIEDVNLRRSIATWILHTLSWNLSHEGSRSGPMCPTLAYMACCAARNFMWKNEANVVEILTAEQQRLPAVDLFTGTMYHFEYLREYQVVESCLSALAMLIHFPNHRLQFAQHKGVEAITHILLRSDCRMKSLVFSMLVILFSGPNPRVEEVEFVSKTFSNAKCAHQLLRALEMVRREVYIGEEERERLTLETLHRGFSAVLGGIRYSMAVMSSLAGSNGAPLVIESLKELAMSSRASRDAVLSVMVPGIAEARRQLGVVLCEIVREFSRDNRLLMYMREACVETVLGELSDMHLGPDLVTSCRMALAVL